MEPALRERKIWAMPSSPSLEGNLFLLFGLPCNPEHASIVLGATLKPGLESVEVSARVARPRVCCMIVHFTLMTHEH